MKRIATIVLVAVLAAASNTAWAASEQVETMRAATEVLTDFVNIPENAIPPALLSQAYGIAVIPGMIKAGFIVGGRYGEGVLSVRTADGTWSHPVFIDVAGASVGWQIGAASSDIILVFKSKRGVSHIINGQVTLGADVSIAAGPVGRTASAATNLQLNAEIYSYSRSRGLFVGVALEGGVITIDAEANWRYYGQMLDSRTILQRSNRERLPQSAQRFVYTLDQYMPPMNNFGNGVVDSPGADRSGGQYGTGRPPAANDGRTQPYAGTSNQGGYGTGRTQRFNAGGTQRSGHYGPVQRKPSRTQATGDYAPLQRKPERARDANRYAPAQPKPDRSQNSGSYVPVQPAGQGAVSAGGNRPAGSGSYYGPVYQSDGMNTGVTSGNDGATSDRAYGDKTGTRTGY